MKFAFLTCDDLSGYVVDDDVMVEAFSKVFPNDKLDVVSWSSDTNWAQYDVAVVRTTWDYTKCLDEFISVMKCIEDSGCHLLNPFKTLEWNTRKTYLRELTQKKVPVLPTVFLESLGAESLTQQVQEWKVDKLVLKPVVGASADDIKVLNLSDLTQETSKLSDPQNWFVQPFIKEIAEGERSFLFFNGELSHSVIKKPKEGDFRVQEEHGGSTVVYEAPEVEKAAAQKVVEGIGENLLYARVDMVQTGAGFKLIELELVEPSLYFRVVPEAAIRFLEALKTKVEVG